MDIATLLIMPNIATLLIMPTTQNGFPYPYTRENSIGKRYYGNDFHTAANNIKFNKNK